MITDISSYMQEVGRGARAAARVIAAAPSADKSKALQAIAERLQAKRGALQRANRVDMAAAKEKGIAAPLVARLLLDDRAIDRMIDGIAQVDALPDPVGEITGLKSRPTCFHVG